MTPQRPLPITHSPARILLHTVLVVLLSGALWFAPRPAVACACGAIVPDPDSDSTIDGETSVLSWDGSHETITMVMSMTSSAQDVAWIMPAPAGTTVELGSMDTIDALREDSQPRIEHKKDWTPRFPWLTGPGASGASEGAASTVEVESTSTVGPFEVVTLASNDADALTDWLVENGYPDRSDLVEPFQDYLDEGWRVLAVRLTPESAGERLHDGLPPMTLGFDTDTPVYPIRLSSMAASRQLVRLYVVSAHQLDIAQQAAPSQPLDLLFSGTVAASDAGLATGFDGSDQVWLTTYGGDLAPSAISNDFTFTQASADEPFQRVTTRWDTTPGEWLGLLITAAVPLVAVAVLVTVVVRRVRGRARAGG
ncbi:DUF2330 domain-containing protein [Propionibacterium australiense]|uniref:DUF2330 domain-containing protein n=1 Tax=Propionibacterium australiense TaxID=119981 RepID=A0A383S964_9ACTN|nr:DUF2330 domain-containing protein [Propionibacterium australiense]RLP09522.1 DUF2330 domain-containing protein [Propionibacterium australiense]RLP09898.1 DUF2330 domain-containing protein [Propionibacterium australiense]SYZ33806.1 Protein of unknown function DUF2330 [Propionibacterium australiense]VEH91929.1 Uncharacterized protein conserved in bacteria (DUF2330) [Propionibacterium australiense]